MINLLSGQSAPPFHCEVDPSVFEPPPDYTTLGPGRSEPMRDEDDNLLQFAIQQSLLDAGTESDQVRVRPQNLSLRLTVKIQASDFALLTFFVFILQNTFFVHVVSTHIKNCCSSESFNADVCC